MNQTATNQSINIVINQTSLSDSSFKESLDLALVCAAFDQIVNLIFIDNGVYNVIKKQNYQTLGDKNHLDILKGLEFYDIEHIFVESESFDERNLKKDNMIDGCEILTAHEINKLHCISNQVVIL